MNSIDGYPAGSDMRQIQLQKNAVRYFFKGDFSCVPVWSRNEVET